MHLSSNSKFQVQLSFGKSRQVELLMDRIRMLILSALKSTEFEIYIAHKLVKTQQFVKNLEDFNEKWDLMFLSCSYFSVFRQLTQLVFSAWFINTNFEANISIFYCLKNLLQLLNAQTSTNNNIVNYFIKLAVLIFSERVSQIFIFPVLKKFDLILKCHLLSCHRGKKK